MLHTPTSLGAQTVEAKTVEANVDLAQKPRTQDGPLRRVKLALEDRLLNTLPIIETGPCNPA